MSTHRHRLRLEQTRQSLLSLQTELQAWFVTRRKRDPLQKYHTQLTALETALTSAVLGLTTALEALPLTQPLGTLYAQCRAFDRRLLWVRRLWGYFRAKFEQRDDTELAPLLNAADEVMWSCYAEATHNLAAPAIPAPLPYVAAHYSPSALPRSELPYELRGDVDADFFQRYLTQLPIPLIGLPPNTTTAPWGLAFIAHEVGHHLQYDLKPNQGLIDHFAQHLYTTVEPLQPPAAERWARWGCEIFADAFALLSLGPEYAWALAELELTLEQRLVGNRQDYPAPITRLALLQKLAQKLQLTHWPPTADLRADLPAALLQGQPELAVDDQLLSAVATAVLDYTLDGLGNLKDSLAFTTSEFEPGGAVPQWRQALSGQLPLNPEPTLRAARLITGGLVGAWVEVLAETDDQHRALRLTNLAKSVWPLLAESREAGTRAAPPIAQPPLEALGHDMAQWLVAQVGEGA